MTASPHKTSCKDAVSNVRMAKAFDIDA